MRMPRVRSHTRPLAGTSIPFRSNFLVNAEIEDENCGDPEQEHQILHRCHFPACPMAGDLNLSLVFLACLCCCRHHRPE